VPFHIRKRQNLPYTQPSESRVATWIGFKKQYTNQTSLLSLCLTFQDQSQLTPTKYSAWQVATWYRKACKSEKRRASSHTYERDLVLSQEKRNRISKASYKLKCSSLMEKSTRVCLTS